MSEQHSGSNRLSLIPSNTGSTDSATEMARLSSDESDGPALPPVLQSLDDSTCREILTRLDEPKSASDLREDCGLSSSTVYRKLELLRESALVPVVIALAWLLGTMAVLDIPFNSETVVITSLAIGLGVDYSIHVSERFVDERARHDSLADALSTALTGTGGALLGSAVTTASGFGVLALALSPPLQRFGIVTGLSIVYAFVACMTVLPCLLVIRERLLTRLA